MRRTPRSWQPRRPGPCPVLEFDVQSVLNAARVTGGSPSAYVRGVVDVDGVEFTWLVSWTGALDYLEPTDRAAVLVESPLFFGWDVSGVRIEHGLAQNRRSEIVAAAGEAIDDYAASVDGFAARWLDQWTGGQVVSLTAACTPATTPVEPAPPGRRRPRIVFSRPDRTYG